ncbi:hypothetical protein FPOAC2_01224 [Fusarium poae]|jgi:hypothetical protein
MPNVPFLPGICGFKHGPELGALTSAVWSTAEKTGLQRDRPEKPILERKRRLVGPLTMFTAKTIHYHLASTSPPNDGLLFLRGNLSYDAHSAISETGSEAHQHFYFGGCGFAAQVQFLNQRDARSVEQAWETFSTLIFSCLEDAPIDGRAANWYSTIDRSTG